MKTYDSIIFDVDGTLWNTTDIVAVAWQTTLRKMYNPEQVITADMLKQLFGRTLPDIASILFPEETKEKQLELIDACCEAEHQALLKTSGVLYPEIGETVKQLSAIYPLFIVSNCQAGYIELFLDKTHYHPYFKGHLCPGDTGNKKAENILQIIHDFHLKSPIYVGDTAGDHQACKDAGIPFVFASYGFGSTVQPDYTISLPTDLIHLFL